MTSLRITNHTRNSILATHAQAATTPHQRLTGLIGMTRPPGQAPGFFFPGVQRDPYFMKMSMLIDVVFIDMLKHRIQKTVYAVEPGCRFSAAIPAPLCAVLELPAGTIQASGSRPGDVVVIMSSTHCSAEEMSQIASLWPSRI